MGRCYRECTKKLVLLCIQTPQAWAHSLCLDPLCNPLVTLWLLTCLCITIVPMSLLLVLFFGLLPHFSSGFPPLSFRSDLFLMENCARKLILCMIMYPDPIDFETLLKCYSVIPCLKDLLDFEHTKEKSSAVSETKIKSFAFSETKTCCQESVFIFSRGA